MLLHVLLLALMLSTSVESSRRARASSPSQALQVSLITEQTQTAEITPPQPIEPPKEESPITPLPTPVPTPKPETKSAPKKSDAKPTATSASTSTPSAKTNNDSQEMEDVIGRIRDNWLEPPGVSPNFRCRLRIDYAVGGKIVALRFLQGCGTLALDDSVKRAIWKTQILSLQNAKREAGSLDIDFTP